MVQRRRRDRAAPWVLLVTLPVLAHWPVLSGWLTIDPIYRFSGLSKSIWMQGVLPGDPFIDGNAGVTTQALGILSARDWLHGVVPWWNPYSGIGLPLAGEMQSSSFFLPFIFLLLLPAGIVLLKIAVQAVAGCATFALLRELGLGRSAALAGGVLFEFNGTFAWIAHAPMLPVAFLPLLLFGIERAAASASGRSTHGWRWIAVAISYSLLAGFPEVAYLDGLLALAWAMWRATTLGEARWRFLLTVAAGGIVGLALAAPLLTSFADFLSNAYVGGHTGFTDRQFVSPNVAMLLFPYVAGGIGNHAFWFVIGGYIGLPALFLAILGLLASQSAPMPRAVLGVWLLVTFACSIGIPGMVWLVQTVPLVRQTMFTNYIAPSWSMAVATLCALAIDDWQHGRIRARHVAIAATITAAICLAVLVRDHATLQALWSAEHADRAFGLLSITGECAVTIALAWLAAGRASNVRKHGLAIVVVSDCIASFGVPLLSGVAHPPPIDTAAIGFLRDRLMQGRFASGGAVYANYGAMFGLASINYNYLPNARLWVDHVLAHIDPSADQVNFPGFAGSFRSRASAYENLAVRYVVVARDIDPGVGQRVARTPLADIYALPHPAAYAETLGGPCRTVVHARDMMSLSCTAAARLFRRELYLPGWTATINGVPASVERYDSLFQAIRVPAGYSEVRFGFRPPYVAWADAAMLAGMSVFALSYASHAWRRA